MSLKFQIFLILSQVLFSIQSLASSSILISCQNNQNGDDGIYLKLNPVGQIIEAQAIDLDGNTLRNPAWTPVSPVKNTRLGGLYRILPPSRGESLFAENAFLLVESLDSQKIPKTLRLFTSTWGPNKYFSIYSCYALAAFLE